MASKISAFEEAARGFVSLLPISLKLGMRNSESPVVSGGLVEEEGGKWPDAAVAGRELSLGEDFALAVVEMERREGWWCKRGGLGER